VATIVLVTANAATPTAGDTAIENRLVANGHTVVRTSDEDAEYGSAYDGVVVSDSCAGATIAAKYATVAKPGLALEQPDWGWGTSAGTSSGVTQWDVAESGALDAGLTGAQTVYSSGQTQGGVTASSVGSGGQVVATQQGTATRVVYLAHESGSQMATRVAPARRVLFRVNDGPVTTLTTAGLALFDAAITYAFPPAGTAPTVDAGADVAAHTVDTAFTRTAGETGTGITTRAWTIVSGPTGAGSTIGTAAALSWTPTVTGTYVLRYSATNPSGTGTDDVQVIVAAAGGGGSGTGALVQSANARKHGDSPLTINLDTAPTAGSLVVAVLGTDKAPGTIGAPAGFTLRDTYAGVSVGTALADAVADQGGDWTWTDTTGSGAVAAVAEFDMPGAVFTAAAQFPDPATDTSVQTITGTLGNAPSAGYVFAVVSVDSSYDNGGAWPVAGTITHTGWDRVLGPVQPPVVSSTTDGGGSALMLLRRQVAAGDSTALTVSWTGSADQAGLVLAHYSWTAGATRTVSDEWLGVDAVTVTTTSTTPGETARVAFSTSSAMTSPTYSASLVTPDAQGVSRHALPALTPNTDHWYQVELGGTLIGTPRPFRTLPAPGAQASFDFGFASCRFSDADPTILDNARSRGIDLFLHLGDLHYEDISSNSPALFRAAYDESQGQPAMAALLRSVPTDYTWSDHDFGGNGSNGSSAARPAAQSVYRERVPHTTLPSGTGGIYHTFRVGRVRFIVLDTRSYSSPQGNTDNSSKTKIGAEQKTWLQGLLAAPDSPLTVIVSAEPWIAATASDDHWGSYQTERTQIGAWITAADTQVVFLCGDAHMLAYDDGTNSVAGVPVYHAAALTQPNPSTKGGPYSGGTLAGSGQYGYMQVVDSGDQVALTYSGIKSDTTVWATHTTTVDLSVTHPAAVAVAGSATVLASATHVRAVSASVAAVGSVTAGAVAVRPASVAVGAQMSVTASGVRVHAAQAAVAGQMSVLAQSGVAGAASVGGQATMLAGAGQTHAAQAQVGGQATVSAAGRQTFRSSATVSGAAATTADGRRVHPAQASVSGAASTTADGRRVHPVQAAVAGQFSTVFTPTLTQRVAASVAGVGRMQATARVDKAGLNISLWAVLGSGVLAPLPAFENLELSRERNGVGAVRVDYPAAGKGFAYLRAAVVEDRPIEVEVWLGGSKDGALRALLTQAEGDDLDGRAVWTFTGTFLESVLADGVVYPQPLPAEKGELRFDAKNPGQVVLTVLQQAQVRGALTGVTRDWTTSLDSSGQSWPNTISGLKYSPKTSLLAILRDLVDKDFLEFELTAARVLRVWAPDRRGVDRTSGTEPTLFRYGRVSSSPLRHSTRDTVTSILAIGADGLSATASDASALARIGRRIEGTVDAGNIDNQVALQAYANAALAALTKGQEEIRHPLTFQSGDPRPKAGYDLADKVLSERAGGSRRAVDVQQWTLTASRQRVIDGEVVLNDLIASRLQRLQRQLDRLGSGGAVIGTSQPPDAEPDTLAPAAPTGLTATSLAYQDNVAAETYAAVTVAWAPVVTNSDNSAADDIAGYRVRYAPLGVTQVGPVYESGPGPALTYREVTPSEGVPSTSFTFAGVGAGIAVQIEVQAFDRAGNHSAWSAGLQIDTASDNTAPEAPSDPVQRIWFRTLDTYWDGLDQFGAPMASDTEYVAVLMCQSASFTAPTLGEPDAFDPAVTGVQHVANLTVGGGTWNQPDLIVGVGWYSALVAIDRAGNQSEMSAIVGPATAEQLVSQDLIDDIIDANKLGPDSVENQHVINGAITTAKIVDAAIVNAKIANLAVNDAKIETLSVGKITTGTLLATVTISGIMQTAASGRRMVIDSNGWRAYLTDGITKFAELDMAGSTFLMTGTYRSGMSGERINILPDGTIRIYGTSGAGFSEFRNHAGQVAWRGVLDGNGRSGRLTVGSEGASMHFGSLTEATPPFNLRSEVAVFDRYAKVISPLIEFNINGRQTAADGFERRILIKQTDSGGNDIGGSTMHWVYVTAGSGPAWLAVQRDSGIKFGNISNNNTIGNGRVYITDAAGGAFRSLQAAEFIEGSSETLKNDIRDARHLLDPLAVIRAARAKAWKYKFEQVVTPPPTEQNPNPQPVVRDAPDHIGPVAEDLPATLQVPTQGPSGESTLGISLGRQVGVLWGAMGQLQDSELVSTSGRVSVTTLGVATLLQPGQSIERPVTWDSAPPAVPTGGLALVQVGLTLLGRITAWIKTGSCTATGAVVVIKNISATPILPTVALPINVEVVGLGTYIPPYTEAS
jgi:hypothetical protein